MQTRQIKTIDVNGLEWFDKINGNSYCAAYITINYGMPNQENFKFSFTYGYGSYYEQKAVQTLRAEFFTKRQNTDMENTSFWRWCEKNKIIVRYSKQKNCLKRELYI